MTIIRISAPSPTMLRSPRCSWCAEGGLKREATVRGHERTACDEHLREVTIG